MTTPEPEFERLVLEHLDGLYNLARWLTRNMDEAQDLVQETALKALKARDQFRGGTTLTAWLYRILRNSFIDRYWKRQREPSGQEGDLPGVLGELEQALEETEIEHLRPLVAADINSERLGLPVTSLFLGDSELVLMGARPLLARDRKGMVLLYADRHGWVSSLLLVSAPDIEIPKGSRLQFGTFRPYHTQADSLRVLVWKQEEMACFLVARAGDQQLADLFLKIRRAM